MMRPDDELCLCFHVTRRKVEQYLRTQRPAVASQLSECYGAGTGCGWCRPFLKRLHQQILGEAGDAGEESGTGGVTEGGREEAREQADFPEPDRYAQAREAYRESLRQSPNLQASESGNGPTASPERP
jgi:NAD(P)H-nitrite reductase large subunit